MPTTTTDILHCNTFHIHHAISVHQSYNIAILNKKYKNSFAYRRPQNVTSVLIKNEPQFAVAVN